MQTCTFFISRPCLSPSPRLSTPATFPGTLPRAKERRTVAFLTALRAAALFEYLRRCTRSCLLKIEQQKNALHFRVRHSLVHHQWVHYKNSVRSACRPVRPPFCFAKPLVRLYAARGVHCLLPAFAHAQSWPLLTNPQPFLATSPRETNTSACAKCESVPKGMVRQKSRNIRCGFFWCTIGDSPAL